MKLIKNIKSLKGKTHFKPSTFVAKWDGARFLFASSQIFCLADIAKTTEVVFTVVKR